MLSRWQAYTWTSFGGRCWEVRSQSGSQVREGLFLYGNPPGEVHPPPEAIDLTEASHVQQLLIPAGRYRHQHAFQREPLALDFFLTVAIGGLVAVVTLRHD